MAKHPAVQTILAIAPEYPPGRCYGPGQYAAGLHRALADAGHRVAVVTPHPDALGPPPPAGVLVHGLQHVPPVRHPDGVGDAILASSWLTASALRVLAELPAPPGRILAHGWRAALAGRALAEASGAPLFPVLHRTTPASTPGELAPAGTYVAELEGWLAQAHRIVVPTPQLADEFARVYVDTHSALVCPPGVWPDEWDVGTHLPDFRALFARPDQPLVLFAGRLAHDNGPDLLLDALAHLPPEVRLVFAGDGPAAEGLRQRADAERVRFTEHIAGAVLASLFRVADVLVCPHRYAPTCQAAHEARACGLPVVASPLGALAQLNGTVHVRPDDPSALAAGVMEALGRPRPAPTCVDWAAAVDALTDVQTRAA